MAGRIDTRSQPRRPSPAAPRSPRNTPRPPVAKPAPIAFACPHCRAVLRAPHDGHGALGDCPHCEAELRVPGGPGEVSADPTAFVPVGKPLSGEELAAATEPAAPAAERADVAQIVVPEPIATGDAPPSGDGEAVVLEFDEVEEEDGAVPLAPADDEDSGGPGGPVARRSSRRSRKRRGNPVLAGVLLLAVLGGAGGAGYLMYDRLAGSPAVVLTATPLAADAAEPAELVPPANADPAAVAVVQAGLPMRSPLLVVTLSAAPGEDGAPADPPLIRVMAEPGSAGRLVRVFFADRPEVVRWKEDRRDLIGKKRLAFVKARDAFFAAVAAGGDVGGFRESVALNAARERARVERRGRRRRPRGAVLRGAGGRLAAVLRAEGRGGVHAAGRDVPGEGVVFPFRYEVTVR